MKIKLIDLGRDKINMEVELKNPSFQAVYKEVKKHIISKHPNIEETDDPHIFDIVAGFHCVGKVWVEKPQFMTLL